MLQLKLRMLQANLKHLSQMAALIQEQFGISYIGCSTSSIMDHSSEALERHSPSFVLLLSMQSAWPCALNTARFATVPGSKRNPCERWQGAKFISVNLIGCQLK